MGITKIKKKNYKQQERVSWYLEFFQAGTFIITQNTQPKQTRGFNDNQRTVIWVKEYGWAAEAGRLKGEKRGYTV